jgi:hypothetical protein
MRVPSQHLSPGGTSREARDDVEEQHERDPLHEARETPVGVEDLDGQEARADDWDNQLDREGHQQVNPCRDASQVGSDRHHVRDQQDGHRTDQGLPSEPILDDLSEPLLLAGADPGGHRLHRDEQRHGERGHPQQAVTGGRSSHRVRADTEWVVVGSAGDKARPETPPVVEGSPAERKADSVATRSGSSVGGTAGSRHLAESSSESSFL